MNQKDREVAREQYYRLEERFLELTQYIPLVADVEETRYEIVSPRAAEFGIDCGTWIDTLMRDLVFDERCNSAPGVENLRLTCFVMYWSRCYAFRQLHFGCVASQSRQ